MRKVILCLLAIMMMTPSKAKEKSGSYKITGKVYDGKGKILKNTILIVSFNREKREIITNEFGDYNLTIRWTTICPSDLSEYHIERTNTLLNPEWILITYRGQTIMIENEWKKYRKPFKEKQELTVNIRFK